MLKGELQDAGKSTERLLLEILNSLFFGIKVQLFEKLADLKPPQLDIAKTRRIQRLDNLECACIGFFDNDLPQLFFYGLAGVVV